MARTGGVAVLVETAFEITTNVNVFISPLSPIFFGLQLAHLQLYLSILLAMQVGHVVVSPGMDYPEGCANLGSPSRRRQCKTRMFLVDTKMCR